MNKGNDIAKELEEIVPGLHLPPTPPFEVPAGYFNQLPEQVLQRIRSLEAETVEEELSALSPLLSAAPRQLPLSAPEGYFDGLSTRIMAGISQEQDTPAPARVVPIRSRRRYRLWAVAASLLALLGLSTLFLLRNNNGAGSFEAQLAGVPDQAILEYLQSHSDAFDREAILANVSGVEDVADELPKISTNLDDLPAEEIQQYLESAEWPN
ncbi:hypothetical protein [uncultured Chitinophaga sp.]|uniref:hypothetical protein n=1 Tax=uncultured Chitinophaga sp. TaxID=339340 RepID=UPI002604A6E6|nr:hypothetical protein [uncultured Chitinophaga sp.]